MEDCTYADGEFLEALPPGFQFHPRDDELLLYLTLKINNERLPRNGIQEVDFYRFDPDSLAGMYKPIEKNEWYFFTNRKNKYKKGSRPDRVAGDGYWRASGADKPIKFNGEEIGSKRSLVYFRGKPKDHNKTGWLMTEFKVKDDPITCPNTKNNNELVNWVICRMTKKVGAKKVNQKADNEAEESHATKSTEVMHDELHNRYVDPGQFSGSAQIPVPYFPKPIRAYQPLDAAGSAQIPVPYFPKPIRAYQPLDAASSMGFLSYGNPAVENTVSSFDHAARVFPDLGSEVAFGFQPGLKSFDFTDEFWDSTRFIDSTPQLYPEQPGYRSSNSIV